MSNNMKFSDSLKSKMKSGFFKAYGFIGSEPEASTFVTPKGETVYLMKFTLSAGKASLVVKFASEDKEALPIVELGDFGSLHVRKATSEKGVLEVRGEWEPEE